MTVRKQPYVHWILSPYDEEPVVLNKQELVKDGWIEALATGSYLVTQMSQSCENVRGEGHTMERTSGLGCSY